MSTAISPSPAADDSANETVMVDLVLAGRNVGAAPFVAGLLSAAQLATAGSPRKLARDVWPGVDPAVVQEIYERGLEVGVYAARMYDRPRFHRDELERIRSQFEEASHVAMGGLAGRSLRLIDAPAPEGDGTPEAAEG